MTVKEFAAKAIENGYTGSNCDGWEWIKENLPELDYIFQDEEYKKQKGMKHKCMPFLLKNTELSEAEESAIGTAWYLNTERQREKEQKEYEEKMIKNGWDKLTDDIIRQAFAGKKKLRVTTVSSFDWMKIKTDDIYKPFVTSDNRCFIMKPKARNKGLKVSSFDNVVFCKII